MDDTILTKTSLDSDLVEGEERYIIDMGWYLQWKTPSFIERIIVRSNNGVERDIKSKNM